MTELDATVVLEALGEPAFLLQANGEIIRANKSAKRMLGSDVAGNISHYITDPSSFSVYLKRCCSTSDAIPGGVTVRSGSEVHRFRAAGARLRVQPDVGPTIVLVRLQTSAPDGFSVLGRKIRDLNAEIHRRRKVTAALEEALAEKQTLLRELQHRVKNNMQMLLGLFSAAKRETRSEEVRHFLDDVAHRLMAVVTAQQLMYQVRDFHAVEIAPFLQSLCEVIAQSHKTQARLQVRASEGVLPNDIVYPLALILNELLTNAFKHGAKTNEGRVSVDLAKVPSQYILSVRDNGPGIGPGGVERRSSGLGLVRGLCRQIGGSLSIEFDEGTLCTVRFANVEV